MSRKKTIAVLAVLALIVGGTGAAAAISLGSYTQEVGVVSQPNHSMAGMAAGASTSAHVGGQTVYAGNATKVDRPAVVSLARVASDTGRNNITLTGNRTGVIQSYLGGLQTKSGTYRFNVKSVSGPNASIRSQSLATDHYTASPTAVVANPSRNQDVIGGVVNATNAGRPLLYTSSGGYKMLNGTLTRLGTTHVYLTANVDPTVKKKLVKNPKVTTTNLTTGNGIKFINSQTPAKSHVYLVPNQTDVPYVKAGVPSGAVMVYASPNTLGTKVKTYLNTNNPNVTVVASTSQVSSTLKTDIKSNTTGSYDRVGVVSQNSISTRLTLLQNNVSEPVVTTHDATISQSNGTATVTAKVTNYGFTAADNVIVTLPKQNGTYTYVTSQPSGTTNSTITWKYGSISPGSTQTIQFKVTGVSGNYNYVPEVQTYQDPVGSTFHGATILTTAASWASPIKNTVLGIYSKITTAVSHLNPLLIGGLVVLVLIVAGGVLLLTGFGPGGNSGKNGGN